MEQAFSITPGAKDLSFRLIQSSLQLKTPAALSIIFVCISLCAHAQAPIELHTIFEVAGQDSGAQLGTYVKGVGDLNKDGYDDVAVSAPGEFRTYVYYGGKTMNQKPSLSLVGGGTIISGDFNGDGWIDLAIEKYFEDTVFIYFGGAKMDTIPDLILTENSDYFGRAMAAGDVKGDGVEDLLISTQDQNKDSTLEYRGRIFIYKGAHDMAAVPVSIIDGDTTRSGLGVDLATGNIYGDNKSVIVAMGFNQLSFVGSEKYYYFSVFKSDSAFHISRSNYIDSRRVVGGFSDHVACFDADGDGIDDILVDKIDIFKGGTQLDTIPSYYVGPPNGDSAFYGPYPWVSGGGDFNKDGVKDILLSATDGYFGGAPGVFVMVDRKYHPGQYVAYRVFSDYLSYSLDGRPENAGDVNGDGVDDIFVGSPLGPLHHEGFFGIYSGDTTIVADVNAQPPTQPKNFNLQQNYPNPFNPTTCISYNISQRVRVSLKVFDLLGREVAKLVDGYVEPGEHTVPFDGSNLPSGIYLYQLRVPKWSIAKKMLLLK